jgi:hypothetical protein
MGVAQGKKVSSDGVADQTIEAQPVFGQIKPLRGKVRPRAETQIREKMARLSLISGRTVWCNNQSNEGETLIATTSDGKRTLLRTGRTTSLD